MRASEAAGEYAGQIKTHISGDDEFLTIAVEDNGIGLQLERERLTEPYVTTREKGTGLGLAIVKKIAEQHGGSLTLSSAEPEREDAPPGARIVIDLPLRRSSEAAGEDSRT